MKNSLVHILIFVSITIQIFSHKLLHEIQNTKKLIELYQKKLQLLQSIAQRDKINMTQTEQTIPQQPRTSIFKPQQQSMTQLSFDLYENAIYMPPNFIVNDSTIIDMNTKQIKLNVIGSIVSVEPYQITTKIADNKVVISNFREKLMEKPVNIRIKDAPGKWHRAIQFQDMFLQFEQSTLMLISQKQTKTFKFKSEILNVFTINQYKILFVTRYQFGYLNAKSLEVIGETYFESIAQSAYFHDGILFVLLKNRQLLVISQENIIAEQKIQTGYVGTNSSITYLGNNYLFLFSIHSECFNVFEMFPPKYQLTPLKQICVIKKFNEKIQGSPTYKYQFFKKGAGYRLFFSDRTKTKMYELTLTQKQEGNSERVLPWKVALIIICILAVIYFKSKKGNEKQMPDLYQQANIPRKKQQQQMNRMIRKQKVQPGSGEQYIKSLTDQIRKAKNPQNKQVKKIN